MTKILVVDDSSTMRRRVRQVLEDGGFAVEEAVDGEDGLERLTADPSFALAVLDVNMPRMSGIELLRRLATDGRIASGLRVVMLTTEGQVELIRAAKAAGAKGWVVKPFKPELFLAAVRRVVA